MRDYLWTAAGGRLQYQSSYGNSAINWLFLPGGPGLGSEALADLTALLKNKIPGVIWHFDLPNDGSNRLQDASNFNWRPALIQAANSFEKVIVVAHSTPGMYVQTVAEFENILQGLVLIGTAPDASWQKTFEEYCKNNADFDITAAENEYLKDSNDESLRKLLIAAAKHCFVTEKSILDGQQLFKNLSVNHYASEGYSKVFDSEKYKASWIPQRLNTLIIGGSHDPITPLHLFQNNSNYQKEHILITEISGAGHYPWFENPHAVIKAFQEFAKII